eukprot:UN08810
MPQQQQQQQAKPQITSLAALRQVQNTPIQQQYQQQQQYDMNNIQLPQLPIDKLSLFTMPSQFAVEVSPDKSARHDRVSGGHSNTMQDSDADDDSSDDNDEVWGYYINTICMSSN